ncbi:MAG TPA: PadR family transcriptional regulator [Acidobacteriaceae bacterium]|jgi:DNA-binding PadR family transcriptional regulator
MYELFLLGKLMERPWHGYEFQQVLNAFVGPMRQVSWGTIYPMLRRLDEAGFISLEQTKGPRTDRRGRQKYSITAAGRQRFVGLMQSEQLNDANYRDTFRVMMGNFSRVEPETRKAILERYLERLSAVEAHAVSMSERVQKAPQLNEAERRDILLALDRDRFLADADRRWVTEHKFKLIR